MLSVVNTTPYLALAEVLRDKHGAETLIVVVKGTFEVDAGGQSALVDDQEPIVRVPLYMGDPLCSSLLCDTDFTLEKPGTDVLVSGDACAREGTQADCLPVRLMLGPIDKRLRVWGDRCWQKGVVRWSATDPQPFQRMPLVYERTHGGQLAPPDADGVWPCDMRNPAGRGFGGEDARKEGEALPNIEYEDERIAPAGFGPIARHWTQRAQWAGTYDDAWRKQRFPLPPLDLDPRFHHCAPDDQQTASPLMGGEPVALWNMTPDGLWQFNLPRVWLTIHTQMGNAVHAHRTQLHTVHLRPSLRRVSMTWVTTLRCQGHTTKLGRVHVREKPRVNLGEAAIRARAS